MKKIVFPASIGYWALLILAPLPILYLLFHYSTTVEHIKELDEKMDILHTRKEQSEVVQKRQHSVLSSLAQSDPFYIDKHLETLIFLESEIKKMEALFSDTALDDAAQKRLHFLKEGPNRLLFAEDKTRSKNKIREVMERQKQQIEMNEEDLKKLLCLVEGVTIWPYGPREGRPQLIIQDFQLAKKRHDAQDHVFVVQLNIIKRENSDGKESTNE
jgi:hypothetical protein